MPGTIIGPAVARGPQYDASGNQLQGMDAILNYANNRYASDPTYAANVNKDPEGFLGKGFSVNGGKVSYSDPNDPGFILDHPWLIPLMGMAGGIGLGAAGAFGGAEAAGIGAGAANTGVGVGETAATTGLASGAGLPGAATIPTAADLGGATLASTPTASIGTLPTGATSGAMDAGGGISASDIAKIAQQASKALPQQQQPNQQQPSPQQNVQQASLASVPQFSGAAGNMQQLPPLQQMGQQPQVQVNDQPGAPSLPTSPLLQMMANQQQQQPQSPQNMFGPQAMPILGQLQKLLATGMPDPAKYQPTRMQRIAASIGGMNARPAGMWGGVPVGFEHDPQAQFETTQNILHAPYQRALANFKTQVGALSEGANVEERQLANQRQLEQNKLMFQTREETNQERERHNKETESLTGELRARQKQDAETRKQIADFRQYNAEHPNAKIMVVGSQVVAVDPKTKETTILKDEDGQPLDSGKLGDLAKSHLQLQNQLAEIHARADAAASNASKLEDQREGNRQKDISARGGVQSGAIAQRGTEQRKTNAEKPAAAAKAATSTETDTTKVTGAKPDTKIFGIHVPFTGSEGTKTTTTTVKKPTGNYTPIPSAAQPTTDNQQRVRVKGPNGEKGTVTIADSKRLPDGWAVDAR